MSIFSMVFASMHLSHALNRGVHHLGRSATFWAVSTPSQASTCVLSAALTFMAFLQLRSHGRPARFSAIIAQWRMIPAGRRPQHAARPSARQAPAMAVVSSATGTSWCPCASLIASDTARLQEPCHGEIFPLAWWNPRRNRVLQVADGWKAAHRDCAATKRRLRHVWGGRKRP